MPNNKVSVIERPYAGFGMEQLRAIRLHRERSSSTPHEPVVAAQKGAIYARVSSAEQRANVERQVERLSHYCEVNGYQVAQVVKEIASGVNKSHPQLLSLLKDTGVTARLYGHRRAKRKTARIVQELQANGDE